MVVFDPILNELREEDIDASSIPDGKPSVRDASGGSFPTTTTSDWWIISVAGTLPAPVGAVVPGDLIAYDSTTETWTKLAALYVNLLTNQTIGGVKTFLQSPIVPNPTTSTQVTNKGTADNFAVAMGAAL